MTVAEIGAGNGRFAVRLAARVGNSGLVYANDIDPKALKFMHNRILNEQISNLVIIKGEINHPHLPENEMDLVCLVNTYDDLSHPIELLKNCRSSLKSNGSSRSWYLIPTKWETFRVMP